MFQALLNKLDKHTLELVRGAAAALALKVLGAGFSFGFSLAIAWILGAKGAGQYFLALTVATFFSFFGRMGLDNTLLRFIAVGSSKNDWSSVKGVYVKGVVLAVVASCSASFLMFVAAPFIANYLFSKPELSVPIRWMAAAVLPFSLALLHAEILKGLKKIKSAILLQSILIPSLTLLGMFVLGHLNGVVGVVWSFIIATIVAAIIGFWLWKSFTPQLREKKGQFKTDKIVKTALPLFWVALMQLVLSWSATIVLGVFCENEDVGVFSVASRTALLTSYVLVAVNSIAAPKFAALYGSQDIAALRITAKNSARLMSIVAGPVLLFFVLAPGLVMRIFGDEFTRGGTVLVILAVGQFINVATGSVGHLLIMSGREQIMRNITCAVALIGVGLNIVFVLNWGMQGAAIATAICVASTNLLAVFYAWKKLRINILPV